LKTLTIKNLPGYQYYLFFILSHMAYYIQSVCLSVVVSC